MRKSFLLRVLWFFQHFFETYFVKHLKGDEFHYTQSNHFQNALKGEKNKLGPFEKSKNLKHVSAHFICAGIIM